MYAPNNSKLHSRTGAGFALIASLVLLSSLALICLAFISLAQTEQKHSKLWHHQQQARANARMALSIALAELQKYAGPDQRITANAAILDTDPSTPEIDGIENPHFLGVWKNTSDHGHHLVGKDVGASTASPIYNATDHYVDLRYTNGLYSDQKWRNKLRLRWLASTKGDNSIAHQTPLTEQNSITLVGKGTLGAQLAKNAPEKFGRAMLKVQKIGLAIDSRSGGYAWAVIDNSQKATITKPAKQTYPLLQLAAAHRSNLAGFSTTQAGLSQQHPVFAPLEKGLEANEGQMISYKNAAFLSNDTQATTIALATYYNHFTNDSSGLFTDPIYGGIKKDLSPLLFAQPSQASLNFEPPSPTTADSAFSSSYPIIPGQRHLAHGPNFDALRYWGKLKYSSKLSKGTFAVDTSVASSVLRKRPTQYWRGQQNDGHTFRPSAWHRDYPKILPVMTDARFHFYFSLTDNTKENRIRTHLIPRVCLWNPYNVELESPEMLVLMPNFFWSGGNFHFQLSSSVGDFDGERERLVKKFPDEQSLLTWDGKLRFQCGASERDNEASTPGLFPHSRYLAFVIEQTTFAAGSCLVFSPKIRNATPFPMIQKYALEDISKNVLSAQQQQGGSHFYHETQRSPFYQYDSLQNHRAKRTKSLTDFFLDEIRLEEVIHYEPWVVAADHFDFVLKASNGSNVSSAKSITTSRNHPTLQLINGSSGGARTYPFYFYSSTFGNSSLASNQQFGKLQSFIDNPYKDAPSLHQIGSKLLWINEEYSEANSPPLRQKYWTTPQHIGYNPATIAHWNVRPQLCSRSPASICSNSWHSRSAGAWITQLAPHSPQAMYDRATLNENGQYAKFPFAAASDAPATHSAALFDLPDSDYGALSIGKLRHAQLSPYSWHPSYLIGSSFPDLHAPLGATAHLLAAELQTTPNSASQWDVLIGSSHAKAYNYGPRGFLPKSNGLLQIGDYAEQVTINQQDIDTQQEMLAYDIVFETNQNIWDSYFISGLQLNSSGHGFVDHSLEQSNLFNSRFKFNSDISESKDALEAQLSSSDGLNLAFWNAGYMLKNRSAFNINSTSIPAWTAFLSGIRGIQRPLRDSGIAGGSELSVFSRLTAPENSALTDEAKPGHAAGWCGGRSLNDTEIASLASAIVEQVKTRGPFISLADMVNRRLIPESKTGPAPESLSGAIEAAILATGLNDNFNSEPWLAAIDSENDYNKLEFRHDYASRPPASKLWGAPAYLTQADLLEPLAPAMTIRGDTFTIRCYGESLEGSKIKATAYLEAIAVRTPNYLDPAPLNSPPNQNNLATDPTIKLDFASGLVSQGQLTQLNHKFGRKFKVKSFRWLSNSEV